MYTLDLPSPEKLRTLWLDVVAQDKQRMDIIRDLREHINGLNKIPVPNAVGFKAEPQHAYLLRNANTAKASRFRHFPEYMVAPQYNKRGNIEPAEEKRASLIEKWHARLGEQWEQQSSVWQRMVEDSISYFVAGERIECAPASDWKDVIQLEDDFKTGMYPYEEKAYNEAREKTKRSAGVPIRSIHVPPDALHWIREGNTTTEVFEVERRDLRAVISNPLFADSDFVKNIRSDEVKLSQKLTVLHYSNHVYHAYYALAPSGSASLRDRFPTGEELSRDAAGQPMLLYSYEHGIGRCIYNIIWGPRGPWDGNVDDMLGRLAALRDLSADADKYKTWLATAARRLGLPTYQQTFDRDQRVDTTDSRPKPIEVEEGGMISLWKGEEIRIIPNNFDIATLQYAYRDTEDKFHAMAGVQSRYGIHQEGAATGYHEAFLLQQSQSTERAQEIALKHGAEGRADIVNRYIKYRIEEEVPIAHSELRPGGRTAYQYIAIGPKELDPMPIMTATVIAPTPQDFNKALANAQNALRPVDGTGRPIMDRQTVGTQILQIQNYDEVERRIDIEQQEAIAMQSPAFTNRIIELMMTQLAKDEAQKASPEQFMNADPALMQVGDMAAQTGETAPMGGMSPDTAMGLANASGMQGVGGGMPEGMAQPQQVMGLTDVAMDGLA